MLTPTETLGLCGATLESRVRQAMRHVSDAALAKIAGQLHEDARLNEVVYERDGVFEPVRILLRPLLMMPEQLAYLHHVCGRLTDALKRLPRLYFEDAQVRSVLRISADEEAWLRDAWGPAHLTVHPIYGRLDAVCDFAGAGWRESLRFMEPNLSGVGGIHFAPLAEELVMRNVVPTLLAHDPDLAIELPRDQRELFLQALFDHAQAMGRAGRNLCFVEPKYAHGGPNEQPALTRYLREKHAATVVHADPRELRLVGAEIFYEDTCVDVAYRDYETRDLIALERSEARELSAMRALFRQNRVVSSIGGDLDHKSAFEVLTDDTLAARYFDTEERKLFHRHVLWTRLLSERRTTLPRGEGELLPYVRAYREELVLKPNRGYGGAGVRLGAATSQQEWETLVDSAFTQADDPNLSWVVQAASPLPVREFPVVSSDGRVHEEPFYVVMGFAPTDGGLGVLCRVSQKQVVNVAQRGGLAAVLVGHKPNELRAPRRHIPRARVAEEELRRQIDDLRGLDAAIAMLGWDEETYLPKLARTGRGAQLAILESQRHRLLTHDRLGDVVEEVSSSAALGSVLAAELDKLRRLRRLSLCLPDELVRAFAQARSHSLAAWEQARKDDDYAVFAPGFARLLRLVRERAEALRCTEDLYDGLLDENEPGMRRARLDPVLQQVRSRLVPLVAELSECSARKAALLPQAKYADGLQERLCRRLLTTIGFDFERGRLDRSTHPFTLMAGEDDVRITVRIAEDNPLSAIFATLHEGGHGLYDQGFGDAVRGTLLAEGPSMGLHESQSRLWENQVGRSRAFCEYLAPLLREHFPQALGTLAPEGLYETVNVVRPGVNRVEADEVTYNLHVLLRYELELMLLSGELRAEDLPVAWVDKSQTLLSVRPKSALEGCLQDVHWSLGAFGYFPTYTLGNLYGAELFEAFRAEDADLEDELRRGELRPLLSWLRRKVHDGGHLRSAEAVMVSATGHAPGVDAFFRALARKHGVAA